MFTLPLGVRDLWPPSEALRRHWCFWGVIYRTSLDISNRMSWTSASKYLFFIVGYVESWTPAGWRSYTVDIQCQGPSWHWRRWNSAEMSSSGDCRRAKIPIRHHQIIALRSPSSASSSLAKLPVTTNTTETCSLHRCWPYWASFV